MGRISMPQGKGSQLHNRREYAKIGKPTPDNIDVTKSNENITLVDRDIREAYEEIFGEALAVYNSKQKRADRKIENYYDHIQKSKNGEKLFYEDVVQWGSKEDFADAETRQKAKEALVEYVNTFERRNQNLKLIGAYIHMDEASPHLHLDYIPVAHGYTRGLATRNSLDRAMKAMGFEPKKESRQNNATKLWKESERARFADICRGLGLEVEEERAARGSLSVEEYKEARDKMMGDIEQEYTEKKELVDKLDAVTAYIASDDREAVKAENMTIPEKKTLLGRITAPERVGVFVEGMDEGQVEALVERVKTADTIQDELDRTQEECRSLIETAKEEAKAIKEEATAERNETVAKAEKIVREKRSIIVKAKKLADDLIKKCVPLQEKYDALVKVVQKLLGKKERLEAEVNGLQTRKDQLEPEVHDLERARDILRGEVEKEITQGKFCQPYGALHSRTYQIQWDKLEKGELVALYNNGRIRTVTYNQHGGMDDKTLKDQSAGLCRIGWFEPEEKTTIPQSLLRELIRVRDRDKTISRNLENLIEQQAVLDRVKSKEREEVTQSKEKDRDIGD